MSGSIPSGPNGERTWQQKVGYGTNLAGSAAGPAAIYMAYKMRKTGGMSRDIARSVTQKEKHVPGKPIKITPTKFGGTAVGRKITRMHQSLDNPGGNKKLRIAAGVAGATAVGIHAANWGGEMVAAHALSPKKRAADQRAMKEGKVRKDASITDYYEAPERPDGVGHSLVEKYANYGDDFEQGRQRSLGRNQALMASGSLAAGAGAIGIGRSLYTKEDRALVRNARLKAIQGRKGRAGVAVGLAASAPGLAYAASKHSGGSRRRRWE